MRTVILIITLFLSAYSEWVISNEMSEKCPYGTSVAPSKFGPWGPGCSAMNNFSDEWILSGCSAEYITGRDGEHVLVGYYFYGVVERHCGNVASDDSRESGCDPFQGCNNNNKSCYDSAGRSFELNASKNCSDYCRGPETAPEYDSGGNMVGFEPVEGQTGTASIHLCSGGDDPFGEKLSDSQTEQGYDGEHCGPGQHYNGTSCQSVPDNCGYLDGVYACTDSNGNTQACGTTSGNQGSSVCNGKTGNEGNGNSGNDSGGSDGNSGNGSGGNSGNGSGDDSGNGSGGNSGNGSGGNGSGSSGDSSTDGGSPNDGTGEGIPDGQTEVRSCDGVAKCQCKNIGLGKQQCFAPKPQACRKGYHWDALFAECMRDDCPKGQFDPDGSPFNNCRPIECDNGIAPTAAGCPEELPDAIEEPAPDDDGDQEPDKPSDPDDSDPEESESDGDVVGKLGEILEAIKEANKEEDNSAGSSQNEEEDTGPCDPSEKDYLSCINLGGSGEGFDGYSSLDEEIKQAREGYEKKLSEATQQFKDKIKITTQSVSSPFYHDYRNVMGAEVDFGTAFLEPFLQYLPALILFLAAVYSAFTILGGYKQ